MYEKDFWRRKKVFITGHTGFKGSWLTLWLHLLGARVVGYALAPPTKPSLFELCRLDQLIHSIKGDVKDRDHLMQVMQKVEPEIVIHMAAQPLVREAYRNPVDTFMVNVMGTVNVLEAVRHCRSVKALLNVTSDKCYENKEWIWGYRENEPLGGYDPYSNSKACAELVTASYQNSFFQPNDYAKHGVAIATARAGNVIGGGDWARDRLIPDCIDSLLNNRIIRLRSPYSFRPWQHVLEPLSGYMMLIEKLYREGVSFSGGWNFGPNDNDVKTVEWIVKSICKRWGVGAFYELDCGSHPHEAQCLKLDCSKAKQKLQWSPNWSLEYSLDKIVEWVQAYKANSDMLSICVKQVCEYIKDAERWKQNE